MQNSDKERSKREALANLLNNASIDCMIALDTNLEAIVWNKMCENVSAFQNPRSSEKIAADLPYTKKSNIFQ